LRDQASRYRNSNAPLAAVVGAAKMAQHCLVPTEQIAAVLRESGLRYDPSTQTVSNR